MMSVYVGNCERFFINHRYGVKSVVYNDQAYWCGMVDASEHKDPTAFFSPPKKRARTDSSPSSSSTSSSSPSSSLPSSSSPCVENGKDEADSDNESDGFNDDVYSASYTSKR